MERKISKLGGNKLRITRNELTILSIHNDGTQ